jgi:hypothetical protein
MDLGLDNPGPFTEAFGPFTGTGTVVADVAVGNRDTKLSQYCLCLILMNVHVIPFTVNLSVYSKNEQIVRLKHVLRFFA